jgi:hypothetical protein
MGNNDFLHGVPEVMRAFNPQAPQVEFGAALGDAAGGMAEAVSFAATHTAVAGQLRTFVGAAVSGIEAYVGIATNAADLYQGVDDKARQRYEALAGTGEATAGPTGEPARQA